MKPIKALKQALFSEEYSIQHKLLNITLIAMFFGGFVCLIVSIIIGLDMFANILIAVVDAFLAFAVYFSVVKKHTNTALILTCIVDIVIFPLMYFPSGGMQSGMTIWFVVSLVVFWLILKTPYCYIMYGIDALILIGCFIIELKYPDMIQPIATKEAVAFDMIQCMIAVSALLGSVFKYQSYIYSKQRESLRQQTIELREAMLALQRANEAKNDFLSNMSHELRTPINAIIGMNETILRESDNETITQYSKNIKNSSRVLLEFVDNVLDFSKVESGMLVIEEYTYRFSELLSSINRIIEPKLNKKGLEYKLTVDKNIPPYLKGDNYKISRVVTHLLNNSVKFTESGYVALTFSCAKTSNKEVNLIINVADTGRGIPREKRDNLFSGFSHFDSKKDKSSEGIGMGLAVIKRLIELQGGTIEVRSILGSGTLFTVVIPQAIAESAKNVTKMKKEEVTEHFAAPKARILAVDDNNMNLMVIKQLLKKYEIDVDTASGGEECIKICSSKQYDLIFMDHMMPFPDGIETLRTLRKDYNLNIETPVVVLTANAIKGARENYLKEGFAEYLSKPVDISALELILRKILPHELIEDRQPVSHESETAPQPVKKSKWIDTEVGIGYFAGNKEIYKDVLSTYYEQSAKYREQLPEYLKNKDMKNYTIAVHALKSTSLNIGASEFSAMAKEQENLGKENKLDRINETFDEFMKCLDEVLEAAAKIIGK